MQYLTLVSMRILLRAFRLKWLHARNLILSATTDNNPAKIYNQAPLNTVDAIRRPSLFVRPRKLIFIFHDKFFIRFAFLFFHHQKAIPYRVSPFVLREEIIAKCRRSVVRASLAELLFARALRHWFLGYVPSFFPQGDALRITPLHIMRFFA